MVVAALLRSAELVQTTTLLLSIIDIMSRLISDMSMLYLPIYEKNGELLVSYMQES